VTGLSVGAAVGSLLLTIAAHGATFPGERTELEGPDGRFAVVWVAADENPSGKHELLIKDLRVGSARLLLRFGRSVSVAWSPNGRLHHGYLDQEGRGHPRTSGTYSRLLGRYVRERKLLSLMEALRKTSLMPARRLEARVPAMRNKGRIRERADADIVVFDAARIIDRATYQEPTLPSQGVRYVLVNGVVVVRDGVLEEGVYPGQPVRATIRTSPGE
jgi:Amidohydrolase family